MADTTLVSRLVHCVKTSDVWASYSVVPKRGELCIENTGTGFKIKVGDGVNVFANLGYVTDNNFSNALYAKLQGIAEGAEVNVQADWSETDSTADAFIKNKPTIPTIPTFYNLTVKQNGTNKVTYDPDGAAKSVNFKDGTNIAVTVDTSGNVTHNFSGILPVTSGGTGASDAATARTNLGLGTAAVKGVVTTLDNSANIPTAAAVQTAIANSFAANDAMIFKGTITPSAFSTVSATQQGLPTTYNVGWTYRVVEAGTIAGQTVEVGDLITAIVDRSGSGNADSDWTIAQTNINGAITAISSGTKITVSGSGSSRTINHNTTDRTNDSSTATPSAGTQVDVVSAIESDATGHVTKVTTTKVTFPADSDEKVKQTSSTSSTAIPVLLASSDAPTSGNAAGANYATNVTVTPSTGEIAAPSFKGSLSGLAASASYSSKSASATSARYATTATNAGTANYAKNASTANYTVAAGTAGSATNASTAEYAKNTGTANYAKNASTANYTKNAGTAEYAKKAGTATTLSNLTATVKELNYMDGVTSNVQGQFDTSYYRANRFFPDSAMHNLVTDCLQINTAEDWTSSSGNRDSVIATEDVSTIVNCPVSSGAFYAYREIRQVEAYGGAGKPKTIVTLKEAYPIGGREWSRAYNPDTGSWDEQWNCHDGACSHRDLGKSITDIVTNGAVYVCTPDRSKTMPICASEFTTGDGHNLTEKVSNSDIFKGIFNSGNIDGLKTYGVYWAQFDKSSTTITGTIPPYVNTRFGYFEVLKAFKAGTDCMQRFTEYFGGIIHTRVFVNGGWLDWFTYNLNDYLPLSGGTLTGTLKVQNGSNGAVVLRSDGEGGNINIHSPSSYNSYWEIDAYNGDLRLYRNNGGTLECFNTFPITNGTLLNTSDKSDVAEALRIHSNSTAVPTVRRVYYGLPTINGSHQYNSNTNIYAPTSVGTKGQVLVSNGSGAPSWQAMSNQIKILNGTVSISVGSDWTSNSANVTFPSAFTVAPLVQASTTDGNGSVNIKSITKTGCVISYYAAADPGTKTIRWTAMGY